MEGQAVASHHVYCIILRSLNGSRFELNDSPLKVLRLQALQYGYLETYPNAHLHLRLFVRVWNDLNILPHVYLPLLLRSHVFDPHFFDVTRCKLPDEDWVP